MLTGGSLSSPNWIIFQKHFRRKGGGVTSDLKKSLQFFGFKTEILVLIWSNLVIFSHIIKEILIIFGHNFWKKFAI